MNLINDIKNFWNELGWLANAIEIIVAILLFVNLLPRFFLYVQRLKDPKSFASIRNYAEKKVGDKNFIQNELKRVSCIAVVDDEIEDFPVNYLRRAGFKIDTFKKISLTEVNRLENYDIVFLDIVGVVEEDWFRGGLELIKRIRELPVSPIVIAISGRKFDPTVSDFFKLADDTMRKPVKEVECEEEIEPFLRKINLQSLREKLSTLYLPNQSLAPDPMLTREILLLNLSKMIPSVKNLPTS